MNTEDFYSEVRLKIGDPPVNDVSNRRLMSYVVPALEWFAGEMGHRLKEDNSMIHLTADQSTYQLPEEVLSVLWVSHNNLKLDPASHTLWDRDGTTFRGATSNIPTEFAIHGRELILSPPPSSSAITTDARLTVRYIAAPEGLVGLSELDQWLLVHEAAILWCGDHQEEQFRLPGLSRYLEMNLGNIKRQHERKINDFQPGFKPRIYRVPAAR